MRVLSVSATGETPSWTGFGQTPPHMVFLRTAAIGVVAFAAHAGTPDGGSPCAQYAEVCATGSAVASAQHADLCIDRSATVVASSDADARFKKARQQFVKRERVEVAERAPGWLQLEDGALLTAVRWSRTYALPGQERGTGGDDGLFVVVVRGDAVGTGSLELYTDR